MHGCHSRQWSADCYYAAFILKQVLYCCFLFSFTLSLSLSLQERLQSKPESVQKQLRYIRIIIIHPFFIVHVSGPPTHVTCMFTISIVHIHVCTLQLNLSYTIIHQLFRVQIEYSYSSVLHTHTHTCTVHIAFCQL